MATFLIYNPVLFSPPGNVGIVGSFATQSMCSEWLGTVLGTQSAAVGKTYGFFCSRSQHASVKTQSQATK